jgi:DNA primase large subunit
VVSPRERFNEPLRTLRNLQNVSKPKDLTKKHGLPSLRGIFKALPGWTFIEIDLAAAHAQIARYFSRDTKLTEANKTGIKLHFYTLETMLKDLGIYMSPLEIKKAKADKSHEHSKLINQLYKLSKNVFYSFLNFSGAATLHDTFSKEGTETTEAKCKAYLKATAETFSDLRRFQQSLIKKVESRQKIKLTAHGQYLGRAGFMYIPDGSVIQLPSNATASKICAAVWLRTEASAIKNSLIRIADLIENSWSPYNAEIVNFSHDSVLLHVREKIALEVSEKATEIIVEDITKYVKDYEHEYESVVACLINPAIKEDYKANSYLGCEIKPVWS